MKTLLLTVLLSLSISIFSQDSHVVSDPGDYEYTWIDSDNPNGPVFSWVDISTSGTMVTGLVDDGVVGPFDIGFVYPFYGQPNTQFWINSNGCISFNESLVPFANGTIPTGTSNVDFIAWFWDDLNPSDPISKVYYENIEDSVLLIQFERYSRYSPLAHYIDAEVFLYESGRVLIQYLEADPGFLLESETIGLQSDDNTVGLLVSHNAPYVHDELAILFGVGPSAAIGLGENNHESQLMTAYPNPANTLVTFDFQENGHPGTLIITDLQGKIVHTALIDKGAEQIQLDLSNLPAGMYTASLTSQRKTKLSELKLVIAR